MGGWSYPLYHALGVVALAKSRSGTEVLMVFGGFLVVSCCLYRHRILLPHVKGYNLTSNIYEPVLRIGLHSR